MAVQASFSIRRLIGLADGNTTVDTVEIPWSSWTSGGVSGVSSEKLGGSGVTFRHLTADAGEWHAPPNRQFVIILDGQGRVEASDGSAIELGPGSIFLMDHKGSKGHFNRSLGPTGLIVAFVPVDEAWTSRTDTKRN